MKSNLMVAKQIRLSRVPGTLTILFAVLLATTSAHARLDFLGVWQGIYPDSNSDEIGGSGCQVCHQSAMGNEPWNAYGWDIRQRLNNNFSIDQAIRFIEDEDPDGNGIQSLDEIDDDFQPGWTEGNNNTIYFENGSTTTGVAPPSVSSSTAIDHPDELPNPLPDVATGAITLALSQVSDDFSGVLVAATPAPGINGSLFVAEKTGKIFRVDLTTGSRTLFHDVGPSLFDPSNGEHGLLGLAFHPDFDTNGLFYTYQSEPRRASEDDLVDFSTLGSPAQANHRSMIVEYRVNDPSCNSFVQRNETLMVIDQPQSNHNGGDIAFGPDGLLYIAVGDGGGSNDAGTGHGARGNGRDNTNPLGAILRIDPLGSNSDNGKYGVPDTNPFLALDDEGVDEIYAYGFRNPFRISFDSDTGELYAADVGQRDIEEIDIVSNGGNYGWNWQEGTFFFYTTDAQGAYVSTVAPPGLPDDLIEPIAQYDHGDGISITGGYVYRGSQIPVLEGRYVFADLLRRLFYLDTDNNVLEFLGAGVSDLVSSFGQDADQELYVMTFNNGSGVSRLHKLGAPGADYMPPDNAEESAQCPASEELCVPIKAVNGNIAAICL